MARRNPIPAYRLHKGSGQAFIYHRSIAAADHRLYLGKFGTDASKRKYRQALRRIEAGEAVTAPAISGTPTIVELAAAYDVHIDRYYRDESGERRREYLNQWAALRILIAMFGDDLGVDFGPKSLKAIQRAMAADDYCRTHINDTCSRIKRFFKWACSEELLDPAAYHRLQCVRGLTIGEIGARESAPVRPAKMASVKGILPFVPPTIGAMIQVQYLCAMRPDEVCKMRPREIDSSGPIWLYTPLKHKTRRYAKTLVKGIPRAAQAILQPFLSNCKPDEFVFKPADSVQWMLQQQELNRPPRKTKRYPSEVRRVQGEKSRTAKRPRRRAPGEHFAKDSYGQALTRAFAKAKRQGVELERFTPNQLRHAIITYIAQTLGQQKAQRYAGHAHLSTTSIYAEIEVAEIVDVSERLDHLWSQAT